MQLRAKHVAGGAITLIVIVSLAILAQSAAGQHVLKRLGIVGHSPSFTELSFDQSVITAFQHGVLAAGATGVETANAAPARTQERLRHSRRIVRKPARHSFRTLNSPVTLTYRTCGWRARAPWRPPPLDCAAARSFQASEEGAMTCR